MSLWLKFLTFNSLIILTDKPGNQKNVLHRRLKTKNAR